MSEHSTPSLFDRTAGARRAVTNHALSFAALAAAVLLRSLLDPWMGDTLPLVTLFGAVAAAVWLGGYSSGDRRHNPRLPRLLLSASSSREVTFGLDDPGIVIGLLAYLFTCSLIIGFGEATRQAQHAPASGSESCCASRCTASATRSSRPTSTAASPI